MISTHLKISCEARARLTAQGLIGATADKPKPVAKRVKARDEARCHKFSCWREKVAGFTLCERHRELSANREKRKLKKKRARIASSIMNFSQSRVNASPIFLSLAISQTALMHPKKLANFRKSFAAQS